MSDENKYSIFIGASNVGLGTGHVDLSRFRATSSVRLSHIPFEIDRAFPAQC